MLNEVEGSGPEICSLLYSQLILFDQSEFFNLAPAITYGMDTAGYLYVPTACKNGASKCPFNAML